MLTNRRAVLHADDDPMITDLVGEYVRSVGFDYEGVQDPLSVVSALQRGKFRIVVLDIHMPGKSGLQLLQEIKQIDGGVQVLLLTALVNEATVIEASRLGADGCLFKPLADPRPLIDALEDAYRRNSQWWETLRDLANRRREGEPDRSGVVTAG